MKILIVPLALGLASGVAMAGFGEGHPNDGSELGGRDLDNASGCDPYSKNIKLRWAFRDEKGCFYVHLDPQISKPGKEKHKNMAAKTPPQPGWVGWDRDLYCCAGVCNQFRTRPLQGKGTFEEDEFYEKKFSMQDSSNTGFSDRNFIDMTRYKGSFTCGKEKVEFNRMSDIELEGLQRSIQECSVSVKPMPEGRTKDVLAKVPGKDEYFYIDKSSRNFANPRPRVMYGKPGRMKEMKVLKGDPLSYDSLEVTDGNQVHKFQRYGGGPPSWDGVPMADADVDPSQVDPKSDAPAVNPCTASTDKIQMSELKLPGRK